MILFSDFHTDDAIKDNSVGISIQNLINGTDQDLYATVIEAGNKVGCHCHHEGEEWYIILSGEGAIFTAEVNEGSLGHITETTFRRGSTFCISANTAHQLVAHTRVELIFLCPPSHLTYDRTGFDSIS
ncbi:cupin domain-containing protein [Pantoea cypripedii]|uniref:cupin domain-containing protein n=1 Tax=Pantoea cypripedii TaxID=55209 RepID=UPI000A107E93|nr:mannose-6-phosphate isomerase-like protein (cupin superfamily) [Pantoea cypripedii]